MHANHAAIALADGAVDGDWLSERLLGVQVLLLAGCHGDRLGDWLGVMPHVVTLDEAMGTTMRRCCVSISEAGSGRAMDRRRRSMRRWRRAPVVGVSYR